MWNMKHISKNKITFKCRGINRTLTDVTNIHTSTVGDVNLVVVVVPLTKGKLLELIGHVVRGARVNVPDTVAALFTHGSSNMAGAGHVVLVVPMPAVDNLVARLFAKRAVRVTT